MRGRLSPCRGQQRAAYPRGARCVALAAQGDRVQPGDLDTIALREPVIHLDDIFRQQLYLALPVKRLCTVDCRGICPCCGVDLNIATCRCSRVPVSSPFAALAALKKK
ncbi:YceD family protein [Thermodesulfobacteriota bacterium B35]